MPGRTRSSGNGMQGRCTTALIVAGALLLGASRAAADEVTVTVSADGSFDPAAVEIDDGTTVTWRFAARPGTTIIPVADPETTEAIAAARICAPKRFDPDDPNEFTGPMPRAQSGIFTLGPDGSAEDAAGFEIVDTGTCAECEATVGGQCLCPTGDNSATMDWTWAQPDITGVLIRLRWNDLQPDCPHRFDFSALDREIGKAVRNGKLYSLSIKAGHRGTPDWLFDGGLANNCPSPGLRVQPCTFRTPATIPRRGPAEPRCTWAARPTRSTATTTGSC